jgi:hypothetical protein
VLGAAAEAEEEVGWDEDSEDEDSSKNPVIVPARPESAESSMTIHSPPALNIDDSHLDPLALKMEKSNDNRSQADSEASYDVVGVASGVPSQAPGSPREVKKGDESEEEDWE